MEGYRHGWYGAYRDPNRSQAKYDKVHTKGNYLKLNLHTDKDIIWWTWNQQSVQGSIKRLIREEMRKTGKTPPAWM